MTQRDVSDHEIERQFMRALHVALADKGLTQGQAESIAGLAPGTISMWKNGSRMPSALRFAEVALKLGIDPGELMDDAARRAKDAGLVADVERRRDDLG